MLFRSDVLTGVLEERYADVNVEVQPELFGSQQNISLHIQNLCETESLQDLSFINNCLRGRFYVSCTSYPVIKSIK